MKIYQRKLFLRQFLFYLLIGIFVGSTLLIFTKITLTNQKKNELKSQLIKDSSTLKANYYYIEREATAELLMLSESPFVKDFIKAKTDSAKFAQMMISFVKQAGIYNQFRFIRLDGNEVFRINQENGRSYIVENSKLQNKKNRYYFKETIKLEKGHIFQSPIDLNIENGQIETPHRIMVRYGTPVYEGDKMYGIIVLNVDLTAYFHSYHRFNNEPGQYYILNSDGYYLHAPDTTIEFGFMYPDGKEKTLYNLYTDYAFILNTEKYSLTKFNGFLIYHDKYETTKSGNEIVHYYKNKTNDFHIVKAVPINHLNFINVIGASFAVLLIIIPLFLVIIISFFWAKNDLLKFQYKNQLIETNKELNKSLASQDLFLTILSHDLKNSLGGFYTFSEFLKENLKIFTTDELQQNIKLLEQSSQLQYDLLVSILEWKKLEMGKTKIQKEIINVQEKLNEIKSLYTTRLLNKKLKLTLDIEENHTIYCDPNSLDAILRNLIDNALKFSNKGSTIDLTTFRSNNNDFIIVKDYGVGISKEKLNNLFKLKNYSTTKGTADEAGTGFGLKLVESLIQHNNGDIRVESILNKGTKFIVSFPTANSENH